MYLTDEEKKMLSGDCGHIVSKCMKVLVKLGEIYGAKRMVEVKNVHSPGVSYRVTGDAGLNYVTEASQDANSASMYSKYNRHREPSGRKSD